MPSTDRMDQSPENIRAPIVESKYRFIFYLVASLFFFWALAASLNDVLIRHFQSALSISRTQAGFVQFAFYIGYFCAAIPAGLVNRRFGYKAGILAGLALYAIGSFLFYPAAAARTYMAFLVALYTIAFGLAFLETSANPYITLLGDSSTSAARLTLAQSIYGLGAVAGPIIGGLFIFSGTEMSPEAINAMTPEARDAFSAAEAAAVQGPYVVIGILVCALAALVAATKFPLMARDGSAPTSGNGSLFRVLRHPLLRWAILTQFVYVGAQVGIWSFFIDFCKELQPQLSERMIAYGLSASLAMLMIGRFSGAFLQKRVGAGRLLAIYAIVNVILCLIAAVAPGWAAIVALWWTSFFMSIMFPTIFALGVRDLGDETELAAPLLVMAIIGGAIVPPAMGLIADLSGSLQHAMLLPALCFAIVILFASHAARLDRPAP